MAKNGQEKKITKTAESEEKEFSSADLAIEGTKDTADSEEQEAPAPRETVRGEDVLKTLRKKGMKI